MLFVLQRQFLCEIALCWQLNVKIYLEALLLREFARDFKRQTSRKRSSHQQHLRSTLRLTSRHMSLDFDRPKTLKLYFTTGRPGQSPYRLTWKASQTKHLFWVWKTAGTSNESKGRLNQWTQQSPRQWFVNSLRLCSWIKFYKWL